MTHQLQYLQDVKDIVVMNAGQIQIQGSYEQIKAAEGEIGINLLGGFDKKVKKEGDDEKEDDKSDKEVRFF